MDSTIAISSELDKVIWYEVQAIRRAFGTGTGQGYIYYIQGTKTWSYSAYKIQRVDWTVNF